MGGSLGNPAMMQVMNILMSQRQPVQPFGPMGIPGGGFGFQGAPGGPGDVIPPIDPGGGGARDDYSVGGVDYNLPSDTFFPGNPSDVGGQEIWLGNQGIPGGGSGQQMYGRTSLSPGDPGFTMPGVGTNEHPGSKPGFDPDPFASLKAIPDDPNLWDIGKGIYGMPNPANPAGIMYNTLLDAYNYDVGDYASDWDVGDFGDWEEF